ncbi:MAG: hypothetical protein DRR16_23685 [Candidatus Parabeggiatoa sp. nov. 3]|nr:MAG: hypothetical protein DRR00_30630 [Gammaproteobacteria bacterium]RKZ53375.1 MAG: hypothetical protein DRQ99_31810 [Gammaproteobacteria bacterium]RKZ80534.1 MAG: hypothetical protein DRR16_23685 [Gammaproteobacteria bacterium]
MPRFNGAKHFSFNRIALKQLWKSDILNNESKRDFYYKLLIIFIFILVDLICGYALASKYSHCVDIKCSVQFILSGSLIITLGPLLFFLLSPTYIIGLVVIGLYISILVLIIIWLFFLKPKPTHPFWALIWLMMGFIIMHEFVG